MASTAAYSAGSPGWETVVSAKTKNNKNTGGKNAAANAAKKKFVEKGPKLEDVLPMEQVASFYSFDPQLKQNGIEQKQSPKTKKDIDESKNKKNGAKNPKRLKTETPSLSTKPKKLEEAVKLFNINEFKSTVAQVKNQYPDNFMLWLRDAALYLNVSLTTENPNVELEEPLNPFSQRPVSVITKETKKILIQLLEECGDFSRQSGYETLLANMGHDLAKGFSVHGYMILLQLMSEVYPTLATLQTKRFTELIKSYQNRANVGTALLWALGQCGRKDLSSGLKIWTEYMRPLLRLKNYTRFVVTYLSGLLKMHVSYINSSNFAKGPRIAYPAQYFLIFDTIFNDGTSISKDMQKELMDSYPVVKKLAIGDCSTDHELFPEFMRRLDDFLLLPNGANNYKNELLNNMAECFANNPMACVSHWQQMYRAHLHSSSVLLRYLDDNWKTVNKSKHLKESMNLQSLFELLSAFKEYNDNCSSQKEGLPEANKACKSLLKKVSTELSGNSAWFPWKICSLLLLISIVGLINMDIQKKGSFKKSSTGIFLKDVGMYEQALEGYELGHGLYIQGKNWAEVKLPQYYNHVKENAGPIANEAGIKIKYAWNEGGIIVNNAIVKANEYIPGLKEKLIVFGNDASRISKNLFEWLDETLDIIIKYLILSFEASLRFLNEVYHATVLCIQDIIDGKTDLSDVVNATKKMFQNAIDQAGDFYLYAKNHISLQMK